MESPAFGQSTNKYKSTPKSYSQIGSNSQPYATLLALTFLEKNIKIFCITIKKMYHIKSMQLIKEEKVSLVSTLKCLKFEKFSIYFIKSTLHRPQYRKKTSYHD